MTKAHLNENFNHGSDSELNRFTLPELAVNNPLQQLKDLLAVNKAHGSLANKWMESFFVKIKDSLDICNPNDLVGLASFYQDRGFTSQARHILKNLDTELTKYIFSAEEPNGILRQLIISKISIEEHFRKAIEIVSHAVKNPSEESLDFNAYLDATMSGVPSFEYYHARLVNEAALVPRDELEEEFLDINVVEQSYQEIRESFQKALTLIYLLKFEDDQKVLSVAESFFEGKVADGSSSFLSSAGHLKDRNQILYQLMLKFSIDIQMLNLFDEDPIEKATEIVSHAVSILHCTPYTPQDTMENAWDQIRGALELANQTHNKVLVNYDGISLIVNSSTDRDAATKLFEQYTEAKKQRWNEQANSPIGKNRKNSDISLSELAT